MRPDNVLTVAGAAATQVTATGVSATTAVPVAASGAKARFVAVKVITASEIVYFRLGGSGTTVSSSDGIPISKEDGYVIVPTGGFSHFAFIRGGTNNVTVQLIPLED